MGNGDLLCLGPAPPAALPSASASPAGDGGSFSVGDYCLRIGKWFEVHKSANRISSKQGGLGCSSEEMWAWAHHHGVSSSDQGDGRLWSILLAVHHYPRRQSRMTHQPYGVPENYGKLHSIH